MGLLKSPDKGDSSLLDSSEALKDVSPFKDVMATMEKPADLTAHPGTRPIAVFHQHNNITSPPKSADYASKKSTFFQVSVLWTHFGKFS